MPNIYLRTFVLIVYGYETYDRRCSLFGVARSNGYGVVDECLRNDKVSGEGNLQKYKTNLVNLESWSIRSIHCQLFYLLIRGMRPSE